MALIDTFLLENVNAGARSRAAPLRRFHQDLL